MSNSLVERMSLEYEYLLSHTSRPVNITIMTSGGLSRPAQKVLTSLNRVLSYPQPSIYLSHHVYSQDSL